MTDTTDPNEQARSASETEERPEEQAERQPQTEAQSHEATIDDSDLQRYVEAMIFSSATPLPTTKISQALNISGVARVKKAVAALNEGYEATERSFRIRQVGGGYQYYILPQWAECLKKLFTRTRKIRLTKAALETMAVVAYKQPVSKNQIEFIRGVACDGVLHNLLEKNLIKISGRSEGPGRSLLYSATDEFLKFFGLNSFDDLPRIAEIEEMIQNMEVERAESARQQDDGATESSEVESLDNAERVDTPESGCDIGADSQGDGLDIAHIEDAIANAIDRDFDASGESAEVAGDTEDARDTEAVSEEPASASTS